MDSEPVSGDRLLSRAQALAWCDEWSRRDRLIVGTALDTALGLAGWRDPDTDYGPYVYAPRSAGYVAVKVREHKYESFAGDFFRMIWSAGEGFDGAEAWIRPVVVERSRVVWPHGRERYMKGLRDNPLFDFEDGAFLDFPYALWVHLSPHRRSRAATEARAERTESVCPRCHLSLPVSGVCDFCEE